MSSDADIPTTTDATTGEAQVERGTYEIIRDRLTEHARVLGQKAEELNAKRLELFGSTELSVIGSEKIRTENNCVPRDIVSVGNHLLFGYNVFIGLKTEISVGDVFSLHTFERTETGFSFEPLPIDEEGCFLADPVFVKEFKELYRYYKEAKLLQLRRPEGKLLAVFQVGEKIDDIKVFRWSVDVSGEIRYIDNRGERDHTFPPSHDFEWRLVGRDQIVRGKHPHISILDEVFVDTVGGDLTIKIENNTEDGLGIYREAVDEPDQSLDDAQVYFAKLGTVILLKILPYREEVWRYLVYNTRTQQVIRIDTIGQSCVQLPEDHGLIFPGGYYLRSGETKTFDSNVAGMEFKRVIRSPNGEDVLYVFHRRDEGRSVLLPYNMIRKEVQTPIQCHGYSLFADGRLVIFRALSEEPTRVHTMQVWQTPYTSDEFAATAPTTGSFLEKIGNADLVRGISDTLSIQRLVQDQAPSVRVYEDLIKAVSRVQDTYHWLSSPEVGDLQAPLNEIHATAELIIDEFEKVQSLRREAAEAVATAERTLDELVSSLRTDEWSTLDSYVEAMGNLRNHRGHLITLRERRYVDRSRLDELEKIAIEQFDRIGDLAVGYLLDDTALKPYQDRIAELVEEISGIERVSDSEPIRESIEAIGRDLELLTEVIGNLKIEDATQRTRILEGISEVLGTLNRARALLDNRRKELLSREGIAEFGARFNLFGQNVSSALNMADTPEKCEAQLSKMMLQLEELESRFSEFDQFLEQLATKREDVYEAFSAKRQALLDQRQRRAQHTMEAADRILQGIVRRSHSFETSDDLNAYFASDAMVMKVRELVDRLRELSDNVRADEVESRLKAAKADASRGLRDRKDIYEEGSAVIRMGRHRFSVNTQALELTMLPRDDGMALHLSGTDFYQTLHDPEFEATKPFWSQSLVSETQNVYRSEYLAACILADAEEERNGLTVERLQQAALDGETLLVLIRDYAQQRYDEGYERGIHDVDAAVLLGKLLSLYATADLLRFAPAARAAASLFWAYYQDQMKRAVWERRARSLGRLRHAFAHSPAITEFTLELATAIQEFHQHARISLHPDDSRLAGSYLFEELTREPVRFVVSAEAASLRDGFVAHLDSTGTYRAFVEDMRELEDDLPNRYALALAWVGSYIDAMAGPEKPEGTETSDEVESANALHVVATHRHVREEAVVHLLTERRLDSTVSNALSSVEVEGLLGQHPRIDRQRMRLRLDEFLARTGAFRHERVPGFRRFLAQRHAILERERKRLRLDEFMPRVMSSFVRNRLINDVYLPLIGDNLAKQIGALGEGKRTDLMGMLLLISPPGYGKTTLMEYIANRLGLVFVKVNGPALGHGVTSLDPAEAPNATARQEVQKINLSLEMGNNVLLYLDDIQHTNPELLQKFISLCDAQRKIEGVWNGETRTYDMRGKRFCVCMAGNPYTESGEKFQIPDMLANRADTYNLGDILEGKEEMFALSYVENALTSNPILAPLTTREQADVYNLVRMARGEEIQSDQLSHAYSAVELGEIRSVLQKLLRVQAVLLKVNQQYILSASQADAFRTEPPFKLQGSYRNMNKLAEKIVPVMNDAELEALLDDHYVGEAQTLTTGAEQNLLKLAELRGRMTEAQTARWDAIKRSFARIQVMGASDDDPVTRVTGQLSLMSERLEDISRTIAHSLLAAAESAPQESSSGDELVPYISKLDQVLEQMSSGRNGGISRDELAPLIASLGETLSRTAAGNGGGEHQAQAVSMLADRLGDLGQRFDALASSILAIANRPVGAVPSAPGGGGGDLTPYLGKLDQTLAALAEAPRGGQIVQTLPPGVPDILRRMTNVIGESLMPVVRSLGQTVKDAPDPRMESMLDRALKNFDLLKDLVDTLSKIDTTEVVTKGTKSRKR